MLCLQSRARMAAHVLTCSATTCVSACLALEADTVSLTSTSAALIRASTERSVTTMPTRTSASVARDSAESTARQMTMTAHPGFKTFSHVFAHYHTFSQSSIRSHTFSLTTFLQISTHFHTYFRTRFSRQLSTHCRNLFRLVSLIR